MVGAGAARGGMLLLVAVLVVVASAGVASAACDISQLSPCAPALFSGSAATQQCCSTLKSQQGCFCTYARNPTYARYINSANARKIISACGLSLPRC